MPGPAPLYQPLRWAGEDARALNDLRALQDLFVAGARRALAEGAAVIALECDGVLSAQALDVAKAIRAALPGGVPQPGLQIVVANGLRRGRRVPTLCQGPATIYDINASLLSDRADLVLLTGERVVQAGLHA